MEGEGTPSEEQSDDLSGQSGSCGIVEFWLEIDSGGVDATVAVDRGDNGRVALVGGKGGVLDIEELSADLQCAIDGLAAMYPHGGAVSNLNRGGEFVVSYGEAQLTDDVPKGRVVGSAQHHLIAGDGGARSACHRIDSLDTVEEGNLIAFEKRSVVVDDGLRELCHGGCRADGEGAEGNATDQLVVAVLGHADAGEAATCDLVRCEDGAAVEFHTLGNVHLDDTEVGLDEGIIDGHLRRQLLEATTQHRIELLVYGAEVGPLGADVHLALGAQRGDGFDGGLADDGTDFGLAVDILTHLAPNLCVDSENFCHCVLLFNVGLFVYSSLWRGLHVHLWAGL